MRLNHRYFNVVYNAEAVDIEKHHNATSVSDRGSDARFFMHPIVFDVEVAKCLPCTVSCCLLPSSLLGFTIHRVIFRSFRIFRKVRA